MDSIKGPLEIAIVGGSLAGLMCGVALKHAGHSVTIFERDSDQRQSHMAGVCLGRDAEDFLARHDRHSRIFSHKSTRVQVIKEDCSIQIFANGRRQITSWDTYYFRLRSCFDGYINSYYPAPPPVPLKDTDGFTSYKSHTKVLDISRDTEDDKKMTLTLLDTETEAVSHSHADLVIGADGPDSFIRSKYLPDVQREYVGYIAWRGTVAESKVSPSTRDIFKHSVNVFMTGRQHCILYTIPGKDGSLEPGERLLNFLWYTNEPKEDLQEIMTDGIDGHVHRNIVPAGRVRSDIWNTRIEQAKNLPLAPPFLEVVEKIEQPFIQVITEFCSPRAAFENGQVLLMGDALSLFRPHTAFSGTQAAFHTLMIEDYVEGRISLQQMEEKMLRYSNLHFLQSIWWGKFYQHNIIAALASAVNYWVYCGADKIKSWWNREESLLRTTTRHVEEYD